MSVKLEISDAIKHLDEKSVDDNLYYYKYKTKYLQKVLHENYDKESVEYISSYSSFKGEVYENLIYELLVRYARDSKEIERFVLKGPHQNESQNIKNGFGIDRKRQIVYKSGYKDISEFDGLFFTKHSIYFVESTVSKATTGLRKRLRKKKSLLEYLFPKLHVRALIIVTEEATGTSSFPDFCTVWVTDAIEVDGILHELLNVDRKLAPFVKVKGKNLIETHTIEHKQFRYFETLKWLLNKSRGAKNGGVDLQFLKSRTVDKYLDIYTKLYMGYITLKEFRSLAPTFGMKIEHERIIVALEKRDEEKYNITYYGKQEGGKLKKIDLSEDGFEITDKEYKGFTTSEIKYLEHILKPSHKLHLKNVAYATKGFAS